MTTILLILLLFTNWLWIVFFVSYRRTVIKEVKKLSEAPAPREEKNHGDSA